MELYKQGAEAKLFKCQLFGRDVMVKQRFNKKYRHPLLDQKLTRKRTLQVIGHFSSLPGSVGLFSPRF